MAVLPTGIGPVTGGYQIERSLRFNSADSAYLNRTAGVAPTSASIGTLSFWARLGAMSGGADIFSSGVPELNVRMSAVTTNALTVYLANGNNGTVTFAPLFRDPSAWYHIVLKFDTQNGTAANRVVGYVNGTTMTKTTDTHISAGNLGFMNNGVISRIGTRTVSAGFYYSGYLTEVNFIDGQALTPSDFGETDSNTGVWKPKAYTGTYGTNGFYLKFADNSNTTAGTLGKDSSGNGNNWTPNNFSVTAGAGNDSLVDSPTSYGTDTGVGGEVRGNYATLNPIDIGSGSSLNNGNLAYSIASASGSIQQSQARTTIGVSSGKWYWEVTRASITSGQSHVGIILSTHSMASNPFSAAALRTYVSDGNKNNGTASAYGASWTNNDVIGVALDMDAGTLVFYKNGSSQGTAFSSLSGVYMPYMVNDSSGTTSTGNINFGQRAFAYTAPSGFKALCTQNLPTPTIGATSTTQANDYFNAVLWTGNTSTAGVTQAISGVGFQPDFLWAKTRNQAFGHYIYDSIRGVGSSGKRLNSAATTAEATNGEVNSFDSDGFTVKYTDTNVLNWSSSNNVGWAWKAGGTGVSNTAGTITSTVSANTTSGFSIVTYTGNNTASTVGHGLGVAPRMVIVKLRSTTGAWGVYHGSLTAGQVLYLNLTDAVDSSAIWNSTAPTSTVFSVGAHPTSNPSGQTLVAYCFAPVAGYSAFGSYTGNGSSDGPFVYTGFRPRFVMLKKTSAADDWVIFDTATNTYNVVTNWLFPNLSNAELTVATSPDILSNGFKLRSTSGASNASGATFIYAAFAESPFKYALAR